MLPCRTKAEGTLIIPQWPSAPFWPLIFPEGGQPAKFVIEGIRLPAVDWILVPGRSGKTLFTGPPNTSMLALSLVFGNQINGTSYQVEYRHTHGGT